MSGTTSPKNPLGHTGISPSLQPSFVSFDRAPAATDYISFEIGTIWNDISKTPPDTYILKSVKGNTATWEKIESSSGSVTSLTGDSGTATPSSGSIQIAGGTNITTAAAGNVVTINGIATPVSVPNGGTGASSLSDGGILLGSGTAAVTATAQPTNGQLLIGSTGVDPVLATLTAGTNVTIVEGAGSITISSTGGTTQTGLTAFPTAPEILFGGANTGMTYSEQTGFYVKTGNLVWITITFTLTAKGSSTGTATISNLPFTITNTAGSQPHFSCQFGQFSGLSPTFTAVSARGIIGTTTLEFQGSSNVGSGTTDLAHPNFLDNTQFSLSGCYHTT